MEAEGGAQQHQNSSRHPLRARSLSWHHQQFPSPHQPQQYALYQPQGHGQLQLSPSTSYQGFMSPFAPPPELLHTKRNHGATGMNTAQSRNFDGSYSEPVFSTSSGQIRQQTAHTGTVSPLATTGKSRTPSRNIQHLQRQATPPMSTVATLKLPTNPDQAPDIKPGDIVIAVMGVTGSGKTTFIGHFADKHVEIGHGLESCTQGVDAVPCTFEGNRPIWLIDTPGFDDTYRTDTDVLREVAQWLSTAYKRMIKLTGIIYLHRISDTRVGNAATRNLRMFKKLCGEDGLGSVVLTTTMWSERRGNAMEQTRENELQSDPAFWKNMIKAGSKVFRHDRGRKSAVEIINYLIDKRRPVALDIQKEMIDQKKKLINTGAGAEIATDVEKRSEQYEHDLKQIREELREAIEKRDIEAKNELAAYKKDIEAKISQDQESVRKLQADSDQLYQQAKEKYQKDLQEMNEVIRAKDRLLEEAHREARELQQMNAQSMEIERLKMELKLREQQYNMKTRCIVM